MKISYLSTPELRKDYQKYYRALSECSQHYTPAILQPCPPWMLERIEPRHRLSIRIPSCYWEGTPTLERSHRLCERHRELHGACGNWGLMISTRNMQHLTENTDKTFQRLRKNWHHGLMDYLMLTPLRGMGDDIRAIDDLIARHLSTWHFAGFCTLIVLVLSQVRFSCCLGVLYFSIRIKG